MSKLLAAVLLSFVFLFSTPIQAESFPSGVEKTVEHGLFLYGSGQHLLAALEFRKAFSVSPYAIFAYNAGRAYLKAGEKEQAYAEFILSLSIEDEVFKLDEESKKAALAHKIELETPEVVAERWDSKWWIGSSIAGAGSALLLTSLYFSSSATTQLDALVGVESQADYDRQRVKIENAQSTGKILLFSGGALLSVGAAVFLWDAMTVEKTERLPSFVITKDSAMLSWGGSF